MHPSFISPPPLTTPYKQLAFTFLSITKIPSSKTQQVQVFGIESCASNYLFSRNLGIKRSYKGQKMESLNDFKATELRLGLPGRDEAQETVSTNKNKRNLSGQLVNESESTSNFDAKNADNEATPPSKVQIVGWPPVRSYRKNTFKKTEVGTTSSGMFIKVSMDGAPYLRKIDLTLYKGYHEFLKAVETMFKLNIGVYTEREGYKGSEYAPAYEDKDGDLMLVGDVPWDMFISSCKKLRIIKGSDAKGLAFGV